jgi:abhydrolase domain-containing protein 2
MMTDLSKRFPATKFVCIGFSMGGNLITKYLGEEKRSKRIVSGISVCQGYDARE